MRVINFSAGPAGLPLPVLEKAKEELLDFGGTGMSIMEQSHRGKEYEAVHNEAVALIKELLKLPSTHEVLFVQGGAHMQFAMVPMNFLPMAASADYVVTGAWGERAVEEAKGMGRVGVQSSLQDKRYTRGLHPGEIKVTKDAAYLHLTSNETIDGVELFAFPDTGKVPLVCDMSSDFMGREVDYGPFSLVYAGAQKNAGPSGVVVVIAHRDFIAKARNDIPKVLRYRTYLENNSLYNTPPTFTIYMIRNVLQWLKAQGGIKQIEAWNREKARLVYEVMDALPGFYRSPVEGDFRSIMNPVFWLPTPALDEKFVAEAKKAGMVGLKGHRAVGGVRASLYNAVTVDNARTLAGFMRDFARANG
jgi:phosphoserine aminotransferase